MRLEVHRGLFAVGLEPFHHDLLDVHGAKFGGARAPKFFLGNADSKRLKDRPCLATLRRFRVEARGEEQ
jgi:hypothetical protein